LMQCLDDSRAGPDRDLFGDRSAGWCAKQEGRRVYRIRDVDHYPSLQGPAVGSGCCQRRVDAVVEHGEHDHVAELRGLFKAAGIGADAVG